MISFRSEEFLVLIFVTLLYFLNDYGPVTKFYSLYTFMSPGTHFYDVGYKSASFWFNCYEIRIIYCGLYYYGFVFDAN